MKSPKVTIVVPVRDALKHVEKLIDDLRKTEAFDHPIIFVDDASSEATARRLLVECDDSASCGESWQYLRNNSQQLFTRTVNRGIRAAEPDTDYYVLLNTDCELKRGWLDRLLNAAEKYPNAGIIGYPDGTPDPGDTESKVEYPNYITGHCILIPRQALEKVGLFCETDPQQAHIASERIWAWKAYDMGFEMYYINGNEVTHDHGGPSWNRDLGWLYAFPMETLWPGRDTF